MSIIQKVFLDPKHRKRGLILAFTIFGISISLITGTVVYQFVNRPQSFPEIIKHEDLAKVPITTFADSKKISFPNDEPGYENSRCNIPNGNWIAQENAKPGIDLDGHQWRDIDFKNAIGSALWLNKTSVSCGDSIDIHASLYQVQSGSSLNKTFHVLRIGWYSGAGAQEVWSSSPIKLTNRRINQAKNNLRMIDTNWPTTLQVQIGSDWTPGFYLVASEDEKGKVESVAPFILRSPRGASKILLSHSFLTWNLYNSFGGRSAYFGSGSSNMERRKDRSRVVSLDRPIVGSGGFSIHRDGVSMVQFLEKYGINYDQDSDINLDRFPNVISNYNELILSGHAEYMTRRIFESIIAARNSGVNIAIFGGNTALWQTRTTESKIGKNRRIIMYRIANEDPITDRREVSIEFRDPRLNIPQTLFTGTMPSGTHVYGTFKSVAIPKWLKIPKGSTIDGISPDSEIEAQVPNNPASPTNIHTIFSGIMKYADPSAIPAKMSKNPIAEVVWFTDSNGQATFNAGLTTWACNLVDTCAYSSVDEKSRKVLDEVTKTVVTLWQERGIGSKLKN